MKFRLINNNLRLVFSLIGLAFMDSVKAEQAVSQKLTPVESLMPMLGGLLLILVIIFFLAYLFKRFSNFSPASKNIKILETQMIGTKEKLLIVRVQQQNFLIGVTPNSINQLGELDLQLDAESNQELKKDSEPSFSSVLSNIVKSSVGMKTQPASKGTLGKIA